MSAESEFKEAVELGKRVLGHITKNNHAPPSFLPQARGLLFYFTTRVGLGIGVEQGRGFVISRLPYCAASEYHESWSPPWFLSITGLECGAIIGREKISALIGIMSERALQELTTTGSKVALGSEYSIVSGLHSGKRRAKHPEVMFDSDLVVAAVSASGLMISIGLSGSIFTRDKERLVRCYGPEITPQQVLGGSIPPAPEMEELGIAIRNASRAALVAAFEPSGTLTENGESGEE